MNGISWDMYIMWNQHEPTSCTSSLVPEMLASPPSHGDLMGDDSGLGVFCSRNGAFPSLRIIFPGLVFSVSGFGFLFLDLGFWFPAVFFVPLPVLFLPAVSSLLQAIRLGGEIS